MDEELRSPEVVHRIVALRGGDVELLKGNLHLLVDDDARSAHRGSRASAGRVLDNDLELVLGVVLPDIDQKPVRWARQDSPILVNQSTPSQVPG
jgi:hypothetical protein